MASPVAAQPAAPACLQRTTIRTAQTPAAGPRWSLAAPAARSPPAAARPQLRQRPDGRQVAARALDTDTVLQGMEVAEFEQLMESEAAVLVDFYTTWCGPCKVLDLALKASAAARAALLCCGHDLRFLYGGARLCAAVVQEGVWLACGLHRSRPSNRAPPPLLAWLPAPQKLEPIYKGRCSFLKVDAQQNYKLAQHYKVSKLPTLLIFRGGVQASAQGYVSGAEHCLAQGGADPR